MRRLGIVSTHGSISPGFDDDLVCAEAVPPGPINPGLAFAVGRLGVVLPLRVGAGRRATLFIGFLIRALSKEDSAETASFVASNSVVTGFSAATGAAFDSGPISSGKSRVTGLDTGATDFARTWGIDETGSGTLGDAG